jgi:hypothetical protein
MVLGRRGLKAKSLMQERYLLFAYSRKAPLVSLWKDQSAAGPLAFGWLEKVKREMD